MNKLSVVIITFNEEKNILTCLNSVREIADEIIVVDSGSTDNTVQICEQQGCRVLHRDFDVFSMQKQFAVDQAMNDWILSIDADETITEKLGRKIRVLLGKDTLKGSDDQPGNSGYIIPIRLYYLGHRMKMSGGSKTLRLFDRRKGGFQLVPVHEYVKVLGSTGTLREEMIHHSYRDIAHHIRSD